MNRTETEAGISPVLSTDGLEDAPPNSLPTWSECALRVDNSEFIAKRVAEGGYGPEPDSLLEYCIISLAEQNRQLQTNSKGKTK